MASSSLLRHEMQHISISAIKSLALVSVAAFAWVCHDEFSARAVDKDSPEQTKTKKVLVVPFHRMKIAETPRSNFPIGFRINDSPFDDGDDILQVEVKEVVDTIHAAAADPNIVALYGLFGQGFEFSAGGWAQVEEVRNALRVFKESHRVHWEPNRSHNSTPARRGNGAAKSMFAYADTFANPLDPANKEYYLASVFPCIHLQCMGELHLLGFSMSYPFLRGALDKYGIKVHVFKHGKYKNAPNTFTEKGYVKDHLENTKSLVEGIDETLCDGILNSRRVLAELDRHFDLWSLLHEYGTFSADRAHKLCLVDYLPQRDPLEALLESNKNEAAKKHFETNWGTESAFDKFQAEEAVSWSEYSAIVQKRKSLEERKLRNHARLRSLSEKYRFIKFFLSLNGMAAPHYNIKPEDYEASMSTSTKEKIAVLHIDSKISDRVARETVNSLKRISKDEAVKCIVLRVDSPGGSATAAETILQQIKATPRPIVCSLGNVAASAGYFIASDCEKIFSMPTTITGSIGVFGVKIDLTGMAKQYGVKVEHVVAGPLSTSNSPFQPMTKAIRENFERSVDHIYDSFKSHVAKGRNMSMESVEDVAQGRVFTGAQARDAGLVDELGGLSRAIAYANRTYTSGYGQVEVWPRNLNFVEQIMEHFRNRNAKQSMLDIVLQLWREELSVSGSANLSAVTDIKLSPILLLALSGQPGMFDSSRAFPRTMSGVQMTADENEAMRCLLEDCLEDKPLLPPNFWR